MGRRLIFRNVSISKMRVLVGLMAVTTVFWWFNWVYVHAATSEGGFLAQKDSAAEAVASEIYTEPLTLGMETLVSLDLRSTEAADAIKYLATKGNLNIAISKNVTGRVSLFLTDVPIRDVFDIILRSNELAYDMQGSVYNVMTESEYRTLYGKKFSDLRHVKTFRLQYAIPQQAFNLLDTLKSEIGRLLVDEDSGTVLVMDTPEKLREMEKSLSVMEQGGMTKVFDLQYASAIEVEGQMRDQLEVNKVGFVRADERSNQLIVRTLPKRMREVEIMIAALDRPTRQVLIDSQIVKVTLENDMDAGINWDAFFTNLDFHGIERTRITKDGDDSNDFRAVADSGVPALTRFGLDGIFGGLDSDNKRIGELLFATVQQTGYELFRYLETIGEAKLMSNPRIMVTENQEAKILVGTREAYITSTSTTGAGGSTTKAEDVNFIDVGISLSVTPKINADGYVTMKIKPEVSSVVRFLTTSESNTIPIVDTSSAETTVMVRDGETIIIGGLRKTQEQFTTKQIPYFGKIPILGPLFFRQTDRDDETTELVVFITPYITSGQGMETGDKDAVQIRGFREYGPMFSDNKVWGNES